MKHVKFFILAFGFLFITASPVIAQFAVISGEEVKSRLEGKRKVLVVDSRLPEEYQEGHIPGAVNIPLERMRIDAARLPKEKKTPLIFYCRGTG